MDDYIRRGKAVKAIRDYAESKTFNSYFNGMRKAMEIVNDVPAADVRPVVRGKWKLLEGGAGRCSNCKSVLKDVWDYDRSDPFCSECGADMREE